MSPRSSFLPHTHTHTHTHTPILALESARLIVTASVAKSAGGGGASPTDGSSRGLSPAGWGGGRGFEHGLRRSLGLPKLCRRPCAPRSKPSARTLCSRAKRRGGQFAPEQTVRADSLLRRRTRKRSLPARPSDHSFKRLDTCSGKVIFLARSQELLPD